MSTVRVAVGRQLRSVLVLQSHRNFASNAVLRAQSGNEGRKATKAEGAVYEQWLREVGKDYKNPNPRGTNWLGGNHPFPGNPSFRPEPPVSQELKKHIHQVYKNAISHKNKNGQYRFTDEVVVRALSSHYRQSMERIRAIIRLGELEEKWIEEKKPLQTELCKYMERYLGVMVPAFLRGNDHFHKPLRMNEISAIKEPHQERAEVHPSTRTVYEIVDSENNEQPVFLPLLDRITKHQIAPTSQKPNAPKESLISASRPGRAGYKFVDISGTPLGNRYERSRPRTAKEARKAKRDAAKQKS